MRIALVTPFAWGAPSAVNHHVALLARQLVARGHHPTVVVSSDDPDELQRMRRLMRRKVDLGLHLLSRWQQGDGLDARLLPPAGGALEPDDRVPVIPLGRSFSIRANGSVANLGLPVDVMARLEHLLAHGAFDVVHVHEPLAPSLSFTAIREARCPVVATFHATPTALLAYELGQGLLPRFFERLDARIVTSARAAAVLEGSFPGEYRVVSAGTEVRGPSAEERASWDSVVVPGSALYLYRGDDRRGLRALLRALQIRRGQGLRRLIVGLDRASADRWPPRPAPRSLASLVEWREFSNAEELRSLYRESQVALLPFLGGEWLLPAAVEALVCGRPVAGPDLPVARDILPPSGGGRLFSPAQDVSISETLDALLVGEPGAVGPTKVDEHEAGAVAQAVEEVYVAAAGLARRAPPNGRRSTATFGTPPPSPGRAVRLLADRRSAGEDGWIHADLHIHTSHSKDCRSPVAAVLATARMVGLGAIAIADHNTIAGAVEARELAGDGLTVIVAEEVMTQQGEVIGLFLSEAIPAGLSFDATLSLIKEQGALVYVPHPFDRLHTTPSYRSLVDNLHRIDIVETYNARLAFSGFNVNAERFAAKYNLVAGAGSDAHVLPGLGTAMLHMRPFTGPDDFLASLREADIVARRKSLFYLQSLKLLQNTLDLVLPGG